MSDLEAGKCESCKFWTDQECCSVLSSQQKKEEACHLCFMTFDVKVEADFGCIKWEDYEDKQ